MSEILSPLYFSFEQYIGRSSNKLTVIGLSERLPSDKRWFLKCQCDCGNTIRVTPYQFDNEKIKSCGCLNHISPSRIDGRTLNSLYGLWFNMISRCDNPNHSKYYRYGKRGIKVCDSWHDFNNFVKWSDSIGGRPQNCTLDRIDNDENYSPENCRWATSFQQSINKSSNIILEYNGESKTLIEWSISTGIRWSVLDKRLKLGWPVSEILNTPVGVERQSKVRKRVMQFDKNENFIQIYNNLSGIPNTFNKKCVNACCLGKRKTHNGYVWKYEGE